MAQALTLWLACRMIAVPLRHALAAMAGPALACAGLAGVLLGSHPCAAKPMARGAGRGQRRRCRLPGAAARLARDLLQRLGAMVRPGPRPRAPRRGRLSYAPAVGSAPRWSSTRSATRPHV